MLPRSLHPTMDIKSSVNIKFLKSCVGNVMTNGRVFQANVYRGETFETGCNFLVEINLAISIENENESTGLSTSPPSSGQTQPPPPPPRHLGTVHKSLKSE